MSVRAWSFGLWGGGNVRLFDGDGIGLFVPGLEAHGAACHTGGKDLFLHHRLLGRPRGDFHCVDGVVGAVGLDRRVACADGDLEGVFVDECVPMAVGHLLVVAPTDGERHEADEQNDKGGLVFHPRSLREL